MEEELWYYVTRRWEDKGVRAFNQGRSPLVNIAESLEFELTYCDVAAQHVNNNTMINMLYPIYDTIPF